ncbi:MAG TPA: PhzF family phenazine biosynthesis protein [Arenimonas sp.]|nr:PhzF family phenazine biosynthesis protein [Arenimonas sp.]
MTTTMTRRFLQCDVFAEYAGAGNGLAVVLNGENLSTEQMQAFAKFTNMSETTFVLPTTKAEASYRVRIFTPVSEMPFAGHPSVGTAHAVLESGLVKAVDGKLVQECAAGLLPMTVQGDGKDRCISVRAPRGKIIPHDADVQTLLDAAIKNMTLGQLPPTLMNNGPQWWCVELADETVVRELKPMLPEIAALTQGSNSVGLSVFARSNSPDYQLVVRAFCPADSIPEDPVTGSANAAIAALMHESKAFGKTGNTYTASQGREVGRDGLVQVRGDDDGEVWIGGKTQTVIEGSLSWD